MTEAGQQDNRKKRRVAMALSMAMQLSSKTNAVRRGSTSLL